MGQGNLALFMSKKRVNRKLREEQEALDRHNANKYKTRGGMKPSQVHRDKRSRKKYKNQEEE